MKISNATHPLNVIAAALQRSGLGGAVLIGNMGAAVHGARVMTDDFDYLVPPFKDLPLRIEALATILGAVVLPPKKLHGTTVLFVNETDMQIDLLVRADGISSYRYEQEQPYTTRLEARLSLLSVTSSEANGLRDDQKILPYFQSWRQR